MAAPGTDAAEGDRGRSQTTPTRATGWRVPWVKTNASSLPVAWLDLVPGHSAPAVSESDPAESTGRGETTEFGRAEVMLRPQRRWSFRRRSHEPELPAVIEPSDIDLTADVDLVALGAEDDDRVWTDHTLAALEEPETDGDSSMAGINSFAFVSKGADDPWSLLADELHERDQHHFTEPASRGAESTALELEQEFWA